MKKIGILILIGASLLFFVSCKSIYRVYNDQELDLLAQDQFHFSEVLFFKVVDQDTAKELTGEEYLNSGVVVGIQNGTYAMLFVPKQLAEEPFMITNQFDFDIAEMYDTLDALVDGGGNPIYNDPSGDYGGLSLSVLPFEALQEANPTLVFDSHVIFIVTTDEATFYIAYVSGECIIFNDYYVMY